jgi:hypothetical protein
LSISRPKFLTTFVLGPILSFGIIPTVIFGFLTREWGTNVIWGSVFGSGFWLSDLAFWAPGRADLIAYAGLLWAFLLVPLVLFFAADLLWRKLSERGKKRALTLLLISFLLDVPGSAVNALALKGFVLPDWALYINSLY